MDLYEWISSMNGEGWAALVIGLLTLIQIVPIKVNPWSWIGKHIGKMLNGEVLTKLNAVEKSQQETRAMLDKHIRIDDERNADAHRTAILHFNNELLRDIQHTREDFIEILTEIDFYEKYCEHHENYQNNRAVHAIANIKRVYDERMEKHDFL